MIDDPYRVLGVPSDADEATIRSAYRALMKRFHPDQGGADLPHAQRIAAAYHCLANAERRAAYDRRALRERAFFVTTSSALPAQPPRQTGRVTFYILSFACLCLAVFALSRPQPSVPVASEMPVPSPAPVLPQPAPRSATAALPVASPQKEPSVTSPPIAPPAPLAEVVATETVAPPLLAFRSSEPARKRIDPAPRPTRTAGATETPPVRPAPRDVHGSGPAVDLKALDRHQVILYNQSFLAGDEARRSRLMQTRLAFLDRLQRCGSDACRRDVYLQRNVEVAAIMRR